MISSSLKDNFFCIEGSFIRNASLYVNSLPTFSSSLERATNQISSPSKLLMQKCILIY